MENVKMFLKRPETGHVALKVETKDLAQIAPSVKYGLISETSIT